MEIIKKVKSEPQNAIREVGESIHGSQIKPAGLFYLSVVYIIWGSTYLAIRVAVREGSGFPPFTMGMMRSLLAGVLLLLWAALRKMPIRPSREEILVLVSSGLLLWTGGNGLVMWAEQRVGSGLAALIVASVPIWAVLIEILIDRRAPSLRLIFALLIGFAGIGLLGVPTLRSGTRADGLAVVALMGASASWAFGSVLQSKRPVTLSPQVSASYQSIIGGMGLALLMIVFREPRPTPALEAWVAWGYLVVFGSLLGFTSYVQALRLLPINVAMTYAYVNPVIAVMLGAVILKEPITVWTIGGAVMVILGVAGVFRDRYMRNKHGS
jgi:drug/metabolite transporter (DMT)-like permease